MALDLLEFVGELGVGYVLASETLRNIEQEAFMEKRIVVTRSCKMWKNRKMIIREGIMLIKLLFKKLGIGKNFFF
ncbi:MAG TPA: hypothetical protein PLE32_25420, partial [Haliscomenobacter sp.]|nr:hypothetical protein [Haliscomenobacter sp.]